MRDPVLDLIRLVMKPELPISSREAQDALAYYIKMLGDLDRRREALLRIGYNYDIDPRAEARDALEPYGD